MAKHLDVRQAKGEHGELASVDARTPTLQLALAHHMAGRIALAETMYMDLLPDKQQRMHACFFLGMIAMQQGKYQDAIRWTRQAIDADDQDALFFNTLGSLLQHENDFDGAIEAFRHALALNASYLEAWLNLGNVLRAQGNWLEARKCFLSILEFQADSAQAYNNLGVIDLELQHYEEARQAFETAIGHAPQQADAYNNLGLAYRHLGRYDHAVLCFEDALQRDPDHLMALQNLGTVLLQKRDYSSALKWTLQLLQRLPMSVEGNQNAALIYLELGQPELAQRHRDLAYGRQSLFVDASPAPVRTVLLLWGAAKGNVPIEFIIPRECNQCVSWIVEYGRDEDLVRIPPVQVVFNAIGDDDVATPARQQIERFLLAHGVTVLNHPDSVMQTARDSLPILLATIPGIAVPTTVRVRRDDVPDLVSRMPEASFPLILRPSGSHGGEHVVILGKREELKSLHLWPCDLYYVSQFVDYRSSDAYYRKYRVIFVDGAIYPYHLAIGPHWMVHYDTADMPLHAWKLDEERRFLSDPRSVLGESAYQTLIEVTRALGLDYGGIDFGLLDDGRVLLFEANATMLVHPESQESVLSYKNPYVNQIIDAVDAMLTRRSEADALSACRP